MLKLEKEEKNNKLQGKLKLRKISNINTPVLLSKFQMAHANGILFICYLIEYQ